MSDNERGEDPELKFYKHREWKPGKDAAQTAVPKKVEGAPGAIEKPSTCGSPWNAAGTWEEKSQKTWAVERLKQTLAGVTHAVSTGGDVKVTEIDITGDASINFIRGKKKYPFDFKLEFTIVGPDDMKCSVVIPDFACDEDAPYDMEFTWKGDDSGRTPEAKVAVGASKNDVENERGLMHLVHTSLATWIEEFRKL